ncbi:LLM class flavin-dependent oxidoreductase [Dehalococcoidia bacterium]|nr:LLM class flavin-dependent oxidoreductase [Dehalococcoidia bacterium]
MAGIPQSKPQDFLVEFTGLLQVFTAVGKPTERDTFWASRLGHFDHFLVTCTAPKLSGGFSAVNKIDGCKAQFIINCGSLADMARQGVVLHHGIESGAELANYGQAAEDAGYESIWVTERYFHEETFSLLGYLAACTNRLKLGVAVVNPYTRNPALLAMAGATLDRISSGRLLLGLGRSERAVIEGKMGMDYHAPFNALRDSINAVRDLFRGQRVDSAGDAVRLRDVKLAINPSQPLVPIYVAAIGPRALRFAGGVADGILLNSYVPPAYVTWAIGEVHAGAMEVGREPSSIDIACMLPVRLTEDPERDFPEMKRRIVRLLAEEYVGEVLLEKGGFGTAVLEPIRASVKQNGGQSGVALITDEMVEAFYVVGPALACKERIDDYRKAGVDLPLILPLLKDYHEVVVALKP